MISLKTILEDNNFGKFQAATPGHDELNINYKDIKMVLQGKAMGYEKFNVMANGKFAGSIYHNLSNNNYIANGIEANVSFPPKLFKSVGDAKDYIFSNIDMPSPAMSTYNGLDGSYQSYGY
jgi:hypothetical protein